MSRFWSAPSPLGRLLIALSIIAWVWLIILPRWSRLESNSMYLKDLERRGIDPSAMYYTDLPMMRGVLHRLERSVP